MLVWCELELTSADPRWKRPKEFDEGVEREEGVSAVI